MISINFMKSINFKIVRDANYHPCQMRYNKMSGKNMLKLENNFEIETCFERGMGILYQVQKEQLILKIVLWIDWKIDEICQN